MDLIDILLAKRLVGKELPPAIINLKGVIPTHFDLPLSGNAKGDVWVVSVDNSEWLWMSDNSSGTISDYEMMGVVFDLRPYRTAADQDVIDSGKQAKITASGMLKGDGNGGVTPAEAGTDYGTYSKPANGIPASDMESAVQTSLGKADTALQSSALSPYRTSADQDVIDEQKAEVDGYYSQMTVGDAEQLVATVGLTEKVPYNFRTAGGSLDIGNRLKEEVVGGTMAWNQIVQTSDTSVTVTSGHKYLSRINGTNTIAISNGSAISINDGTKDNVFDLTAMFGSIIADYIYTLETNNAGAGVAWFRNLFPKDYYAYDAGSLQSVKAAAHKTTGFNQFNKDTSADWVQIYPSSGTVWTSSSCMSAVIKCLPNTKYFISKTLGERLSCGSFPSYPQYGDAYDTTSFTIVTNGKKVSYTTGSNDKYLLVWFYNANIDTRLTAEQVADTLCVNISWDGERDGEYEAYSERNYPLDASLELRGIPKLDSSNKLYYDGDVYESSGTVTRKYGIIDLGILSWSLNTGTQYYASFMNAKKQTVNAIVSNGRYTISTNGAYNGIDMRISLFEQNIWLCDSGYSTAESLKTALSGVYLVYELATPITESAEAYRNPQVVDNWGTEEYVDAATTATTPTRDVAIPVGHNSFYKQDLRAKLEMVPNPPDSNGDYLMRHTNGENSYVTYTSPVPAVTSVDNGKFARVVNGAWAAVTIPEAAGGDF